MWRKNKKLEFSTVTTRGGDTGDSFLYSGERRGKDDPAFETVGEIDELSSRLGVVKARIRAVEHRFATEIASIQTELQRVASMVATRPDHELAATIKAITDRDVEIVEKREADLLAAVEIAPVFVLPGEIGELSALIDVARAVCRRCERRIVTTIRDPALPRPDLHACQRYLNRLSDYLFIFGRYVEQHHRM
ncbi:MAG: cob(I)yrinic acid a,c-diamide adenosyltransferase [Spirochaetaceae bacterium]|nr:MAG: cob(I)yrinic acid a,c-diamide adenosyltransferase [Spirochaetaceae bacterium]